MDDLRTALGKRIQKLRQGLGMTQEQLAEKAEISPKNVSEFERGRGNPTLSSLESLAAVLGISMAELFETEHERLSADELRRALHGIIDNVTDENCRVFYRLLRALTK